MQPRAMGTRSSNSFVAETPLVKRRAKVWAPTNRTMNSYPDQTCKPKELKSSDKNMIQETEQQGQKSSEVSQVGTVINLESRSMEDWDMRNGTLSLLTSVMVILKIHPAVCLLPSLSFHFLISVKQIQVSYSCPRINILEILK